MNLTMVLAGTSKQLCCLETYNTRATLSELEFAVKPDTPGYSLASEGSLPSRYNAGHCTYHNVIRYI